MTNPTPRPALRKAEDATVHPAAPRPVRAARTPKPAATPAADPSGTSTRPRTIADTNRDADAAAAARAKAGKGKDSTAGSTRGKAASSAGTASAKSARKKRKFSGSTSDHMRVPDTEFAEHPRPKGERRSATKPATKPAAPAPAPTDRAAGSKNKAPDLMSGKVVDLGAKVPKKLRAAAKVEAKKRGLDLDAVTTELLYTWLQQRR